MRDLKAYLAVLDFEGSLLTRVFPQPFPKTPIVAVCGFPLGLPARLSKELLIVA